MRDLDDVDGDLRVLASIRRVMASEGWRPSLDLANQLLDERLLVTAEVDPRPLVLPRQSM